MDTEKNRKVKNRIRKLTALAQSPYPAEAAAAAYTHTRALLHGTEAGAVVRLVGREADVRPAARLFDWLNVKIMEMSPKYAPVVRDLEGFCLGMVFGVEEILKTEFGSVGPEDRRIVPRGTGLEEPESMEYGGERVRSGTADPNSFGLGKAAGRKIRLPFLPDGDADPGNMV